MAVVRVLIGFLVVATLAAAPAMAAVQIPEPSDVAIFLLGVAGLIIGRRSATRRKQGEDADA